MLFMHRERGRERVRDRQTIFFFLWRLKNCAAIAQGNEFNNQRGLLMVWNEMKRLAELFLCMRRDATHIYGNVCGVHQR